MELNLLSRFIFDKKNYLTASNEVKRNAFMPQSKYASLQ
jgi:hypothetical protein